MRVPIGAIGLAVVPHSLLFEDVILVSCIRGQCILETHLPILNTIEVNGAD